MKTIKQDATGIFIANARGDGHYRPGGVPGYDHVYDMGDGGLKVGQRVRAYHVSGAPLIRIHLDDGRTLYWATEYQHSLYAGYCGRSTLGSSDILIYLQGSRPRVILAFEQDREDSSHV